MQFQADLIDQVGIHRARGIVIDVAALDVLDSFASKSLHDLANIARLRGAETVIVGIQPEVAFALVQLPRGLEVPTALDLEEGLADLERVTSGSRSGHATLRSARRTQPQPRPLTQRRRHIGPDAGPHLGGTDTQTTHRHNRPTDRDGTGGDPPPRP